jgi:hypothetical protein
MHSQWLWEGGISLESTEKCTGQSRNATYTIRGQDYKRGYKADNYFTFKDVFFSNTPWPGGPRGMNAEKEGQ